MNFYKVHGGKKLNGTVRISGSKNAALPMIAASLLTKDEIVLKNVPFLQDILMMKSLLEKFGKDIAFEKNTMIIKKQVKELTQPPYDIFRSFRASICVLGPLLAFYKKADISLPGGCSIGTRPVDLHIKAMKMLGAQIQLSEDGILKAQTEGLVGTHISLLSSNGVTVLGSSNTLMAATLAKGQTVIDPSALEPEVGNLGELLIKMGADINGLETPTLTISGVKELHGASHRVIPDRIEAGTFIAMVGATGGDVFLDGVNIEHLGSVIEKSREAGIIISEEGSHLLRIKSQGKLRGVDITTEPYPFFPTDMQAQFMALLTQATGDSVIDEKIFENRLQHAVEFKKMGAHIKNKKENMVLVEGPSKLQGTSVNASDLRAGASLVIAGLIASGETIINNIFHTDRGYEDFEQKISQIGGHITRLNS